MYQDPQDYLFDQLERDQSERKARAIDQGYIDPNQFDEAHEDATGEPGTDRWDFLDEVLEAARHIATKHQVTVTVEARLYDEEGHMDFGRHVITVTPKEQRQ